MVVHELMGDRGYESVMGGKTDEAYRQPYLRKTAYRPPQTSGLIEQLIFFMSQNSEEGMPKTRAKLHF